MNVEARKAELDARRAELLGDLAEIERQLEAPADPDWGDRATERQGDEVLEQLGAAEQAELRRIDAALDRIDQGTYGTCVRCGETISGERLNALPDTPLCRRCAGAVP